MKPVVNFHGLELKADYNKPRLEWQLAPDEDQEALPEWCYHRPHSNQLFKQAVTDLTGFEIDDFGPAGTRSKSIRWKQVYTIIQEIDLELLNLTPDNNPYQAYHLDRIVIHGEAFRHLLTTDQTTAILRKLQQHNFYPQRVDLNFDVSADYLSFDTIDQHFLTKSLTSPASYYSWTSSNDRNARTWYVGRKESGNRVAFYEAAKIHPELPTGAWRVELQLYRKDAQAFIRHYLRNPTQATLVAYMLRILKNKIAFRTLSADRNKARRKIPAWWLELTAGAGNFSEHKTVTKAVKAENQLNKLNQYLKSRRDRMGRPLFEQGLDKFFLETYGRNLASLII